MNDPINSLTLALEQWSNKAIAKGWLTQAQAPGVPVADQASPAQLFESTSIQNERPLVVGFFGGTGAGKSTLLNRLAGSAVALASAERPTSREITLYMHHSTTIAQLPEEFPVEKIRESTHQNENFKNVLWIDMPDFDSVETANRNLVYDWLPHIDMLVYVVSPDRYRDDSGWQMLMENAQRHAWVFVINHWDRGAPEQKSSFQQLLLQAGLKDPLLFCTDCSSSNDKPNGDDFDQFQSSIVAMAQQQFIDQLDQHGVLIRISNAKQQLDQTLQNIGDITPAQQIINTWTSYWHEHSSNLVQSLRWKFKLLAQPYKVLDQGFASKLWASLRRKQNTQPDLIPTMDTDELIDDGLNDVISTGIDRAIHDAVAAGFPLAATKQAIQPVSQHIKTGLSNNVRTAVEQSLTEPGTPLQRIASKILRIACFVLPLVVLGWAMYRLIGDYAKGDQYLGFSFATHTIMLLAVAWLIPWIAGFVIRPTHERAAQVGQQRGIEIFLDQKAGEISTALQSLDDDREQLITDASNILNVLPENLRQVVEQQKSQESTAATDSGTLSRVLVAKDSS